jgi:hypothetical protein
MPIEPNVLRNWRIFLVSLGQYFPFRRKERALVGGGAAILLAYEGQVWTNELGFPTLACFPNPERGTDSEKNLLRSRFSSN